MNEMRKLIKWLLPALTAVLVLFTLWYCYDQSAQPLILKTMEVLEPGSGPGCLDINAATAEELEELPSIGPVLARRILDWREENGPFAGREDVLAVSGIGEATYETIRPYISFG